MQVPTDPDKIGKLWGLVRDGGFAFVMAALFILTFLSVWKKWLVPGWLLTERDHRIATLEKEVALWRDFAISSSGLARRFGEATLASQLSTGPGPMQGT